MRPIARVVLGGAGLLLAPHPLIAPSHAAAILDRSGAVMLIAADEIPPASEGGLLVIDRSGDSGSAGAFVDIVRNSRIPMGAVKASKKRVRRTTLYYKAAERATAQALYRAVPGNIAVRLLPEHRSEGIVIVLGEDVGLLLDEPIDRERNLPEREARQGGGGRRKPSRSPKRKAIAVLAALGAGSAFSGIGGSLELGKGHWAALLGAGLYPSFLAAGGAPAGTHLGFSLGLCGYLGKGRLQGFAAATYGLIGAGRVDDRKVTFWGPSVLGGGRVWLKERSLFLRAGAGFGLAEKPLGPTLALDLSLGLAY